MTHLISRRALIATGSAAAATVVSGCDQISNAPSLRWILDFGQFMSLKAQRLLLAGQPLVREFTEAHMSPEFPPNGTERPNSAMLDPPDPIQPSAINAARRTACG